MTHLARELEATPVQAREDLEGVVVRADLSHPLDVLAGEVGEGVLELAGVAHVLPLRGQALELVVLVPVVHQVLGPRGHAEVVIGVGPTGRELEDCGGC